MDMTTTVNELNESVREMMVKCKRKLGEEAFGDELYDAEALELMSDMFHMCDLAMRLVTEQAKTIIEINDKLDKLLEKN